MDKFILGLSYLLLAICIGFFYYENTTQKTNFKDKEKALEQRNDSLLNEVRINKNIIKQLDSLALKYKEQIEKDKQALSALKIKAESNKKQHNEELNRINTLSKSAIISEFTETFK